MATKRSAGILLFRRDGAAIQVLLAHPGGPYWARRDEGAWSIPKGELEDGEEPLICALRELDEELGPDCALAGVESFELGSVRQRAGKIVEAWGAEGRFDPAALESNTFSLEWPPRSGNQKEFPEVDRAEWFDPALAQQKIIPAQAPFIDRLLERL
ncbi:MAG: NUDIX domain-containing protein [Solirubrobacterales bacterium]